MAETFTMSAEETAACERVADAIIDLAQISAERVGTLTLEKVKVFFDTLPSWEEPVTDRFFERVRDPKDHIHL